MSTQSVISIIKNGKTFIKVVCGCNGFNADKLVGIIKDIRPEKIQDFYNLALIKRFGCKDCLVVMDNEDIIFKGEEECVGPLYRKTFNDPSFNPRWHYGTADYIFVLEYEDSGEIKILKEE